MSTVLTEIKKEHDEVRELLKKLSESTRVTWSRVEDLYITLRGHHQAEENVVFPKVRTVDAKAKALVEHLIDEHDTVEKGIKALIDAHKFDREKFAAINTELTEHMDEEEADLFRKAKKAMTDTQLESAVEPFEAEEKKGQRNAKRQLA